MSGFEQVLVLFVAAVVLAAAARRVGAPYPVFLALGGALLAFLPGAPSLIVPPELALAPAMPWAAAIALGAMVAPPDAVAATAVLRQVRPPQRLVTILEGESLL